MNSIVTTNPKPTTDRASLVSQLVRNLPAMQETLDSIPGLGGSPAEEIGCDLGFPCGSAGKESAYSAGDLGSISGLGRSPGAGNDNPPQYSCLENYMGRGGLRATAHGATSQTQLSTQQS